MNRSAFRPSSLPTAALLAGLGTALPALGQAITIEASDLPTPGVPITISMSASYGAGDYAVAGLATSLIINESQGSFTDLRLVSPMDGPGTAAGVLSAGSVDGILAGQLNFPTAGIFADPSNPIAFWEADFTLDAFPGGPVLLDVETRTTRFDVYLARDRATSESRLADLDEGSLLIVIPAPAGAFVLAGGLAMAARRRR
jgi:hypothetical protein